MCIREATLPKQHLKCDVCKKEFDRYVYGPVKRCFCSKKCESIGNVGKNNPNYGNKWTKEQKSVASEKMKTFFQENPGMAYERGKSNRGKKFSKERIEKMHGHRTRESYIRVHNEETRKLIGKKSSLKWTEEYKKRNREIHEQSGEWIPLSQKSDWQIYQQEANWIERMFDVVEDPRNLLGTYGVFNNKTNTKGAVRDHVYSRKSGFENKIFPEILRHPANCQLLLHAENVSKKTTRYVDKDGYAVDELFKNIENYAGNWKEHELVLTLIESYKSGKRYERTI